MLPQPGAALRLASGFLWVVLAGLVPTCRGLRACGFLASKPALSLYSTGFDGKTFPYKSRGEYQSLVYSENSKLGLSVTNTLRTRRLGVTTVVDYFIGPSYFQGEHVIVRVTGNATAGWGLQVTAGGKNVTDHISLRTSGMRVRVTHFDPPASGVRTRVVVHSAPGNLTITQRWNQRTNSALDFLNWVFALNGPLTLPVYGDLGPSYNAAVQAAAAGPATTKAARALRAAGRQVAPLP